MTKQDEIIVSVVMPCLNEAETIGDCIQDALRGLKSLNMSGEIVIADNGSTDRSVEIATSMGARVVHQQEKGYGSAYLKGITEAYGKYIVIGDSDGTYDFSELERFVTPLCNGSDMVMGNRFKGKIMPGAMPWHHQYIGNPILSGILNLFYHTGVGDAHCGIRSFTRAAFNRMQLQTTGMEFASEIVINASQAGLHTVEVPVVYRPRPQGSKSKLRSFRDGWRHLRFMLLYSPTWLFMIPGLTMAGIGILILLTLVWGPLEIGPLYFDIHYMVLGSLMALLGFQVVTLGLYAKVFVTTEHFQKPDPLIGWLRKSFNLEWGILAGAGIFLIGLFINGAILYHWIINNFGSLSKVREAVLAMTLMVLGAQTVFSSFFLSVLELKRDRFCNPTKTQTDTN